MSQALIDQISQHSDVHSTPQGVEVDNVSFTLQTSGSRLLVVAPQRPGARILLSPESDYTRSADQIGVSAEAKVGQAEFDARYVVRDEDGKASALLNDEVRQIVTSLEPFTELELGAREYRLLTSPENADVLAANLKSLARLVTLTRA